jgi:putative ABC transport system substrate-binding protein
VHKSGTQRRFVFGPDYSRNRRCWGPGIAGLPAEQETTLLFAGTLAKLRWVEGRNVHIDYRTYSSNPESLRAVAAELIASHPDVIFAAGVSFVAVREQTQTIPIVFTQVSAPVERGFVASLARPGG